MKELAVGKYIEKKSRFYTHLYSIDDETDVENILKKHRLQYKKANHHCYALSLSKHHEVIEKSHDDGEVGHPGKVLLQLLKSHGFDHHLIMVSRIFGGIKLGVGGVTKAFKNAAKATITHYQSQR